MLSFMQSNDRGNRYNREGDSGRYGQNRFNGRDARDTDRFVTDKLV